MRDQESTLHVLHVYMEHVSLISHVCTRAVLLSTQNTYQFMRDVAVAPGLPAWGLQMCETYGFSQAVQMCCLSKLVSAMCSVPEKYSISVKPLALLRSYCIFQRLVHMQFACRADTYVTVTCARGFPCLITVVPKQSRLIGAQPLLQTRNHSPFWSVYC